MYRSELEDMLEWLQCSKAAYKRDEQSLATAMRVSSRSFASRDKCRVAGNNRKMKKMVCSIGYTHSEDAQDLPKTLLQSLESESQLDL